jgi:hypothetical protein
MDGAVEVVHEDRPSDPDLVPEPACRRELLLEAGVRGQVLARVRLARIDEVPAVLRMPFRELVEQRTLRCAVRSGEGAELEHDAAATPEFREAHALAVEQRQLAVGSAFAGVQRVREGTELALVLPALDVLVEALVVVGAGHQPGREVVESVELVTAPAATGFPASRFCQRSASE